MTDISVIIVSYNCLNILRFALSSVHNATEGLNADVYVVDNASTDGTSEVLKKQYEWVNVIENNQNLGFGKANNMAMQQCKGRVVLLLNPDTIIPKNFLHSIIEHYQNNPKSGAIGVQMTNGRGVFLRESKRGYTNISNSLFKLTGLWRLAKKSARINGYYLGNIDKDERCEAPILSGACMAFPHTLMDKVGLFDEAYFMYSEDIDLSWRMHKASEFKNQYLGNLQIIHFKGICTPRNIKYVRYFYSGMLTFAKKYEFPHHGHIFNNFIGFGISMAFGLATLKCIIAQLSDKLKTKSKVTKVLRVKSPTDIKQIDTNYDTISFSIDSDIEKCIAFMQKNKKQFRYGFYNEKTGEEFIYMGR